MDWDLLRRKDMRTEKEIREWIENLRGYRKYLVSNFAGDNEIDIVDAEIYSLLWVLEEEDK